MIMMSEVEITKMSSKGQIVIPRQLREEMNIKEGEVFAVVGSEDAIILKKIETPSEREVFEKLNQKWSAFAKKKGWKEEDLQNIIQKRRKLGQS